MKQAWVVTSILLVAAACGGEDREVAGLEQFETCAIVFDDVVAPRSTVCESPLNRLSDWWTPYYVDEELQVPTCQAHIVTLSRDVECSSQPRSYGDGMFDRETRERWVAIFDGDGTGSFYVNGCAVIESSMFYFAECNDEVVEVPLDE